jgi:hypothetical protein
LKLYSYGRGGGERKKEERPGGQER